MSVSLTIYKFFQLLYALGTLRLFINENSAVNAMYGVFLSCVFVITALKSCQLNLPRKYGHLVNTANFFGPLVTVLTRFHCIK